MTSGRWLLGALAVAGTLAGWVVLAERAPRPTSAAASARVEAPEPVAWPDATSVEPRSLAPTSLEPAPVVDGPPDATSAATRRRGRR